jgi:hypothetical protein
VVAAHAAALNPGPFYTSPKKMKQEKLAMNSSVRVALGGEFRMHLEAISSNPLGNYSAVQKIAATFLLSFLKFPKDVKLTSEQESTVTISKQLLESAAKLLIRNEDESFITGTYANKKQLGDSGTGTGADAGTGAGVSASPKMSSLASSWRTSEEGNLSGYQEKRSEIQLKSRLSFEIALKIGEFLEFVIIHITSHYSTNTSDLELTSHRLAYLEDYFETSLSNYLHSSKTKTRSNNLTPFSGSGECKDGSSGSGTSSSADDQRSTRVAGGHPIYSQVLHKLKSCIRA